MGERVNAITMPKWGMTMTEGKIAAWLVGEGDRIEPGKEVVEIETTKITNVIDTPASGILRRRLVGEGATAPVGSLLAVVAAPEVSESEIDTFVGTYVVADAAGGDGAAVAPAPRLVSAGSHHINVLTMGSGEAAPIVLVHGFGGDLGSWLFNQPELARDRVVHAIDLPAHGESSLSHASGGVADLAQAVLAAMDSLAITRAHLIGHSLGGAIALFLAMKHAGRVASAVLIAPGGLGPEINMSYIRDFLAAGRRKAMQDALGHLFADPNLVSRQMTDAMLQFKRRDGATEALGQIAAANFSDGAQAGGMRAGLADLKVPVTVIWGALDGIIPVKQSEALPQNIVVHVMAGAGHMPHMEQAQRFNALVRAFLAAVEVG